MKNSSRKTAEPASVKAVLAELKRRGSPRAVAGLARYGIVAPRAFGISVGTLRAMAKRLGRDHALAGALWQTGWYEARMLASMVDDPARVTPAQMDRWCRDFDNWAICDTCCFVLFDRTPHAFKKVAQWAKRKNEFEKRAAFALIASLGVHDKQAPDAAFARCLPLIERAATDERNFVKKGVSWALRVVGRRSAQLHAAAMALARRLADSKSAPARWIGHDALRDLQTAAAKQRLKARAAAAGR